MDADRRQLISDLRSQLAYHLHLGITDYIQYGSLRDFLAQDVNYCLPVKGNCDVPVLKNESGDLSSGQNDAAPAGDREPGALALADITVEVSHCQSCLLHQERLVPVAGRGGGQARLLIVGGWLIGVESSAQTISAEDAFVFGREEDQMLARMVAAIHLRPEECFVTNIIKCGIGPHAQPRAEHIAACLSYLRRQIELIRPDVICAMGPIAVRTLLGQQHSLSRLRGRFYPYSAGGREIQLMPTYHPTYLLRNPEMKAAVWADLQAIERQLGG